MRSEQFSPEGTEALIALVDQWCQDLIEQLEALPNLAEQDR